MLFLCAGRKALRNDSNTPPGNVSGVSAQHVLPILGRALLGLARFRPEATNTKTEFRPHCIEIGKQRRFKALPRIMFEQLCCNLALCIHRHVCGRR